MCARTPTGLCGLLAIDKPAGPTSHDIVARVRRITGERRIGHGGTLDPLASGLLIIAVGPATRLTKFFLGAPKTYLASIAFGSETDTDDSEGTVTATADVPSTLAEPECARRFLESVLGEQMQTPPDYSAVKVSGKKAYEIARKGGTPDLEPRRIDIHKARLAGIATDSITTWDVELEVSKGTYIRSLARDWGRRLHSAAHISALRRTSLGSVGIQDAATLESLEANPGAITERFMRLPHALGLPTRALTAQEAEDVRHGRTLPRDDAPEGPVALIADERLLAVYVGRARELTPDVVIPGGCG